MEFSPNIESAVNDPTNDNNDTYAGHSQIVDLNMIHSGTASPPGKDLSYNKAHQAPKKGSRGGVMIPFPEKLHQLLSRSEADGFEDIVSWQPHGRCFVVHRPKRFVEEVMPLWFKQSEMTSFNRQLQLYGFSRLTTGLDRGGYYHEFFLRGRVHLCKHIVRTRVKGTGMKSIVSALTEPNFYEMEPSDDVNSMRKKKMEECFVKAGNRIGQTYMANSGNFNVLNFATVPLLDPSVSSLGIQGTTNNSLPLPFPPISSSSSNSRIIWAPVLMVPTNMNMLNNSSTSLDDTAAEDASFDSRCFSPIDDLFEGIDDDHFSMV